MVLVKFIFNEWNFVGSTNWQNIKLQIELFKFLSTSTWYATKTFYWNYKKLQYLSCLLCKILTMTSKLLGISKLIFSAIKTYLFKFYFFKKNYFCKSKQARLPRNKKDIAIGWSADQVQFVYVGSIFQSAVYIERLTSHNPAKHNSFVRAIEESGEKATSLSKKNTGRNWRLSLRNFVWKQNSIREEARFQSLSLPQSGTWLSTAPILALRLHPSPSGFCVPI